MSSQAIPAMIRVTHADAKLDGIEDRAVARLSSALPGFSGRILGRNGPQIGSRFVYELFVEHDEAVLHKLSSVFNGVTVCPGYTAVFACVTAANDEREISAAWDFLYGHWLKASMFEQDDIPYFEEYVRKDGGVKKLILRLPIRPRENFYKIAITRFEDRRFVTASQRGPGAEKAASDRVVDYIAERYPFLLKTQKEFYVARANGVCACGMRVDEALNLPGEQTLQTLTIPKGAYAVLEGSCYGSGDEYERVLLGWLRDNSLDPADAPFSVYDTSRGTGQGEIVVRAQVMIRTV